MKFDLQFDATKVKISDTFHISEERAEELNSLTCKAINDIPEHSHEKGEDCNCPQLAIKAFVDVINEHAQNVQEFAFLMFKSGISLEDAARSRRKPKISVQVVEMGEKTSDALIDILNQVFKK